MGITVPHVVVKLDCDGRPYCICCVGFPRGLLMMWPKWLLTGLPSIRAVKKVGSISVRQIGSRCRIALQSGWAQETRFCMWMQVDQTHQTQTMRALRDANWPQKLCNSIATCVVDALGLGPKKEFSLPERTQTVDQTIKQP